MFKEYTGEKITLFSGPIAHQQFNDFFTKIKIEMDQSLWSLAVAMIYWFQWFACESILLGRTVHCALRLRPYRTGDPFLIQSTCSRSKCIVSNVCKSPLGKYKRQRRSLFHYWQFFHCSSNEVNLWDFTVIERKTTEMRHRESEREREWFKSGVYLKWISLENHSSFSINLLKFHRVYMENKIKFSLMRAKVDAHCIKTNQIQPT